MQLLKHRFGPVLVGLLLVLAGCAVWRQASQSQPMRFSHEKMLHQSIECADCHTETATGAKAGMPTLDTCLTCHEEIDKPKPPERQVASLFTKDMFNAIKVTAIPDEVIFSHKTHTVDHKVACAECHAGIPQSTEITPSVRVEMKDCISCHAKAAKAPTTFKTVAVTAPPEDCATCHQTIRKEVKPASHLQNWTRFHGQKAKDGDMQGQNQCSLCHTQDTCNSCHKTTQPATHNAFWRERGHGMAASIDRDTCATCHQSDTCTTCHQATAPRTHRGQWGGTKDKHCVSCHIPVSGEGCAVCHEGTPSHAKATPTPPTMVGTDCRACHGVPGKAKNLPHADNGDNCTYCHH